MPDYHDEITVHHYLNGRLSPDERRAFEAHLATCNTCHRAVVEWQQIASAVEDAAEDSAASLPPLPLPATQRRPPMTHVLRPQPTPRRPISLALIAALAVVAVALTVIVGEPRPSFVPTANQTTAPTVQKTGTEVLLLNRHVLPGEVVRADDLVPFVLPPEMTPTDAVQVPDDVAGAVAVVPLTCGQPIQSSQVTTVAAAIGYPRLLQVQEVAGPCDIAFDPLPADPDMIDIPFSVQSIAPLAEIPAGSFTQRPYPAQLVPSFVHNDAERLIDQQVLHGIPRETLLSQLVLAETWLRNGTFVVLTESQFLNTLTSVRFGDTMTVGALMRFVEGDPDDPEIRSQPPQLNLSLYADDVQVFPMPDADDPAVILGLRRPDVAERLTFLAEAGTPLMLVHIVEDAQRYRFALNDTDDNAAAASAPSPDPIATLSRSRASMTIDDVLVLPEGVYRLDANVLDNSFTFESITVRGDCPDTVLFNEVDFESDRLSLSAMFVSSGCSLVFEASNVDNTWTVEIYELPDDETIPEGETLLPSGRMAVVLSALDFDVSGIEMHEGSRVGVAIADQTMTYDAEVLRLGDDATITLAVQPEAADAITAAIQADTPITLTPPGANAN